MKTNKITRSIVCILYTCLLSLVPYALCFVFLLFTFNSFSQGAAINSTGAAADNSAMLDVSSTNQGMRIPRVKLLSTTDVTTVQNPVNSLLVFDSLPAGDITTAGYYYWDTTATPDKWVRLATGANWQLTGNIGTNSGTNFIGTTDNFSLGFRTNSTNRMIIDSLGNVGIGTTIPGYKLEINSGASWNTLGLTSSGDNSAIEFNNASGPTYGYNIVHYSDRLDFGPGHATGWNARVTFKDDGNVGIGTILPEEQLHINNSNGINLKLQSYDFLGSTQSGQQVWLGLNGKVDITASNQIIVANTHSTVGFAGIYLQGYTTGIDFVLKSGSVTAGDIAYNYVNRQNTKMTIQANGNVGIGTTTPAYELDVNGFVNTKSIYEVSDEGLVLGMNFNSNNLVGSAGSEKILDASCFNNHGTNNGATATSSGGFNGGGALNFDGSNDYVDLGSASSLQFGSSDFSISFWIKETNFNNYQDIISEDNGNIILRGGTAGDRIILFLNSWGNYRYSGTLISGAWNYVVVVKNGQTLNWYINGVLSNGGQGGTIPATVNAQSNMRLGYLNTYLNGSLDEVNIYKRVLSAEEVKQNYLQRAEYQNSFVNQKNIYVSSVGNVGIGTVSPQVKFHAAGTTRISGANGMLQLTGDLYSKPTLYSMANGGAVESLLLNPDGGNVGIGTTNPTSKLYVAGNICYTGTIGACSDMRYKKDIVPLSDALTKVVKLQGVHYYWRTDNFPQQKFDSTMQIGLIAQNVEKIYPEIVTTNSDGYKTIDYSRLTPVLIEAMKEQQKMIDSLKLENKNLQSAVGNVKAENKNLKVQNTTFSAKFESLQADIEKIKQMLNMEAKK
ncbi:MAG: hypothetical protein HGB12_03610 [Bacteroidetes bacterium]|nr:hypothetical protein [Bacteroidota bacterium]